MPDNQDDARMETLDAAVRNFVAGDLGGDELVNSWIVVVATRGSKNGGVVLTIPSDNVMPQWEARGMLATSLRTVDRSEDSDQ